MESSTRRRDRGPLRGPLVLPLPLRLLLLFLAPGLPGGATLAAAGALADPGSGIDPVRGELVVFVQPGRSEVARDFEATWLPAIGARAGRLGVGIRVLDAGGGAPAEVHLTPLLVFQNHRGRTVFQGRYTTLERLENFLRTFRYVPGGSGRLVRTAIPVLEEGRVRVATPVKITPLTGERPVGHDDEAFEREARAALTAGLERFQPVDSVALVRSDRLFYLDLYPHRSGEDGRLYLALRLFSQFHCHDPIFTREGREALAGSWEDRDALFAEAARLLEEAVVREIASTAHGDGFDPIPADVPVVGWGSLGLELPRPPETATSRRGGEPLGRDWILAEQTEAIRPMIQFRFPAPLDGYSGWARRPSGTFRLGEGPALTGSRGRFLVPNQSLTMGDRDLDRTIQMPALLDGKAHPVSRFRVDSVTTDTDALAYGRQTPATVTGTLEIKGRAHPVRFTAFFEPIVGEDGRPRLVVEGAIRIRLKEPYGIEGPLEGPWPESDTVQIDVSLVLEPAGQ